MERGIRISDKHGVNASVQQCFYCMKDMGLILFGRVKKDLKAPCQISLGHGSEPCDECKEFMEMGIILISIDEEKTTDLRNPWRSGGWVVVQEEAFKRIVLSEGTAKSSIDTRMAFVPDETWDSLKLPRWEK